MKYSNRGQRATDLSHHAVPRPIDLLAMLAVGPQVEVIGELHMFGDLLEDVDAEALAAALDVDARVDGLIAEGGEEEVETQKQKQRVRREERSEGGQKKRMTGR